MFQKIMRLIQLKTPIKKLKEGEGERPVIKSLDFVLFLEKSIRLSTFFVH